VVGVCYGHQIVGRALDAPVGRNEKGWEAAVNAVELSPKGKEIFGVDKLVRHYFLPLYLTWIVCVIQSEYSMLHFQSCGVSWDNMPLANQSF
jgi:hypothetical protein